MRSRIGVAETSGICRALEDCHLPDPWVGVDLCYVELGVYGIADACVCVEFVGHRDEMRISGLTMLQAVVQVS